MDDFFDFFHLALKNIKYKIDSIKDYLNKIIINRKWENIKESNKIEIKDAYKNYKNQIKYKQKILNKRNAGVDLIRIVSMLGIVYSHVLFIGKGISKYKRYESKLSCSHTYVFWHNNAFALVSGIVGYKSTKYSNLLYLWLCTVFYSVGIHYYYLIYKKDASLKNKLYQEYYPVIYGKYWYFSSYFGMFLFLPAINKGIQYLSKPEFRLLVTSILGIFVFWYNYIGSKIDFFSINKGSSTIWLLCLYIIGAYIGKYNIQYIGKKRYIINLIYLFIFLFSSSIYNKYKEYKLSDFSENYKAKLIKFIKKLMSKNLNSVIKTTQAILITLIFLKLKYNESISKFITFFGQLTFGVYLIHINHNVCKNYLINILNGQPYNLTISEAMKMIILKSIQFFFKCIIIEYLRLLLFTILRIRKICILIEKIILKIFSS